MHGPDSREVVKGVARSKAEAKIESCLALALIFVLVFSRSCMLCIIKLLMYVINAEDV